MSIFGKLFGGGKPKSPAEPQVVAEREISGVLVQATPINEGGQFRLGAKLSKEIGGEMRHHMLIRADVFTAQDDAVEAAFRKAERAIKEQGDGLFS